MKKRDKTQYCLKIKKQIIDYYGKKCECCGEDNINLLNIDHINGFGRKHREKTTKRGGHSFYLWLRKNNFPSGYRVLCSNCNMCIGHNGFCPHKCNGNDKCHLCNCELNENNSILYYRINEINICNLCVFKASSKKQIYTKNWLNMKLAAILDKKKIIDNYGKCCARCGEKSPLFLTIDHINGGGNIERKLGLIGVRFYRYLKSINYPKDNYQLLCYNCNCNKKVIEKHNDNLSYQKVEEICAINI